MAVFASEYIAQLTSPPFLVLAKSKLLRPITNGFIAGDVNVKLIVLTNVKLTSKQLILRSEG